MKPLARSAPFLATALLATALWATTPAGAALIVAGGPADDQSSPGLLSVDPDLFDFVPVELSIALEPGDPGSPLSFNSVVDNFSGGLWAGLDLVLEGASFASVGSVEAVFGEVTAVLVSQNVVQIQLDPAESFGLDLGDLDGFGEDWLLDLGDLAVDDTFTLRFVPIPVPEPTSLALVAGGLALLGLRSRTPRGSHRTTSSGGSFR